MVYSDGYIEASMVYIRDMQLANVCIYRPPDCKKENFHSCIETIRGWLSKFKHKYDLNITGDFNFPDMQDWRAQKLSQIREQASREDLAGQKKQILELLTLTEEHYLNQVVKKPTRSNNVLDLVFMNTWHRSVEVIENEKPQITDLLS